MNLLFAAANAAAKTSLEILQPSQARDIRHDGFTERLQIHLNA
jgi:hypothetical protein